MKNPRLLLTAFLTCCMTAAPQNAAAQSPMRTSSSVPPQVELMYVKGLRYLQNAQKTDGTYDGTYGREPGIIGFCLMSVLAHGDDPNAGPYATMVRRCVDYILSKQNKVSGYIGDSMYNHGFATLALAGRPHRPRPPQGRSSDTDRPEKKQNGRLALFPGIHGRRQHGDRLPACLPVRGAQRGHSRAGRGF